MDCRSEGSAGGGASFCPDSVTRTLPSGLRVVVIERPSSPTVAVRFFVRVGSRHDGDRPGLTHFLEHALLKGTTRRTSRQIHGEVEALGSRIDAITAKDYLGLSAVIDARSYPAALDVLADVLRHPRFDPSDLEAERDVILGEMRRRGDMRQVIWDLFDLTLWQAHPLRHRVLGYERVVEALTLEDVATHYRRYCAPASTLVVLSGGLGRERALDEVACRFEGFSGPDPTYPAAPAEPALLERRSEHLSRSISQTHLVLGWQTVGLRHPDSYVLRVIERILGIGGSSRLYQALRERSGLVYFVYAVRAEHEDAGHFSVYTACDPTKTEEVAALILVEVERLRQEMIDEAELAVARSSYAGSLAVAFEANLALAGIVGIETLLLGEFEPFDETTRRVRAVTHDDVQRVAQRYLDPERYAQVSVGPS